MGTRRESQPGLEVAYHDAPEISRPGSAEPLVDQLIPTPEPVSRRHSQRIRGMRKRDFRIVLSIIVLFVLGAVAGGVAANRTKIFTTDAEAKSSNLAPSPDAASTTSTTASATATSGILALDCPNIDGTNKTFSFTSSGSTANTTATTTTYTYMFHCESDGISSGGDGAEKWNTTTIDECVQQCATHNHEANDRSCGGVVWNGNLTSAVAQGGNCDLKLGAVTTVPCKGCVVAAALLV